MESFPITGVHCALAQEERWLNTARPLTAEDLSGRIILIDFWTYCCINCMHVIPDLQALEKEFGKALTVIGVHSAKFQNEKETENIRGAILRYEIEHAVINDSDFKVWQTFGIHAWPTLVLINPKGLVENVYSGEGHRQELRREISQMMAKYAGRLNTSALPYQQEKTRAPKSILKFPGKLAYAEDKKLLFISDSNNNRILGVTLEGEVKVVVGKTGEGGNADGSFGEAQFSRPQGVLYADGSLYIADTENHLLRKADLAAREVTTLAGTGEQGNERAPRDSAALRTPLSSPWDLVFYSSADEVAIAMAGTHQLWTYHLKKKTVSLLAGNGRESIDDGRLPNNSLSQPSGLSLQGDKLFFVDSETSSLRVLHKGSIETLIGTGLFDFGLKDGPRDVARMQHSLGLYADTWAVTIADTYNHAIRRYDLRSQELTTFAGKGRGGFQDGSFDDAEFSEPNDVIKVGSLFYVCDTNNHQIRILDIATRKVKTLRINLREG